MSDSLPLDLHERAVVHALRAFFAADDALSLVVWSLELGCAWWKMCEERRRRREDAWKEQLALRLTFYVPDSGFDYRSVYVQ